MTITDGFQGYSNSHLFMMWQDLNRVSVTKTVEERINWVLDNIKIGSASEKEMRGLLKKS